MDDNHPADPVGRITAHALPHLSAGYPHIESPGIKGRSHIFYPFDPLLNIFNNLIITCNKNDLPRAKIDGIHTVPDSIDIDQLSVQSDGIGTGQKEIGG